MSSYFLLVPCAEYQVITSTYIKQQSAEANIGQQRSTEDITEVNTGQPRITEANTVKLKLWATPVFPIDQLNMFQ